MITNRLRYLTAGESHGTALVAVLEGLPAGMRLDMGRINQELARRQRGYGAGPRMKIEQDEVYLLGGVMAGETIGSPLALQIANINHVKWRGRKIEAFTIPRPGHADLTGAIKYGYRDLRLSLERASARETAARVVVGAVCKQLLAAFGIDVFGYVTAIGEITAEIDTVPLEVRGDLAEASDVRCPDLEAGAKMRVRIRQAMEEGDTLGGMIEVIALGLPPGLGSHVHWDRKLEARLGAAVLGIQAIKGVAIGPAFENARLPGTAVQDAIELADSGDHHEGERNPPGKKLLHRPTNRAGGLEGGITTGQPLVVQAAMKPIATTLTPQLTVDLASGESVPMQYERSDFCPVPRAVPIVEAAVAFILADALLEKLGGDSMAEMKPRFEELRRATLDNLEMDNKPKTFWP